MTNRARLMLAAMTAAFVLTAMAGTAVAGRLSFSNSRIRVTWRELEFQIRGAPGITCPVTVEGSFHSGTIQKVVGALIGYISRATTNTTACVGGQITALQNRFPWHISYNGFTGRLPTIESVVVRIVEAAFLIRTVAVECLYQSTPARPMVGHFMLGGGVRVTGFLLDELFALPLAVELTRFLCGTEAPVASPKGNGTVMLLNTTNEISVRLI